jgi:DNA repair protein RadC
MAGSSVATTVDPLSRPRERLLTFGHQTMADAELLAAVLGGARACECARELLSSFGGLKQISTAVPHELMRLRGVGKASAVAVAAAFELGRRAAAATLPFATPLRDPSDVEQFCRAHFGDAVAEHFVVLGLDVRQRVRLVRVVAVGSLSQVDVHPREVFRPLLRAGMHSVIVVHNHPSGDPDPSAADLELTRRLSEVGRLVGVPLLDHVIVASTCSVSLMAAGLMPT